MTLSLATEEAEPRPNLILKSRARFLQPVSSCGAENVPTQDRRRSRTLSSSRSSIHCQDGEPITGRPFRVGVGGAASLSCITSVSSQLSRTGRSALQPADLRARHSCHIKPKSRGPSAAASLPASPRPRRWFGACAFQKHHHNTGKDSCV